jgi:hypothetical protein
MAKGDKAKEHKARAEGGSFLCVMDAADQIADCITGAMFAKTPHVLEHEKMMPAMAFTRDGRPLRRHFNCGALDCIQCGTVNRRAAAVKSGDPKLI